MRWLRYAGNCAVISAALWASRYVKCGVMITITEGGALRQHATHVNTGRGGAINRGWGEVLFLPLLIG